MVCSILEKNDIPCWIAPRDVRPGHPWDEEIINGIENTKAMIILLSEESNKSDHVKRELEYAVSNKSAIFPVRIHDVQPSKKISLWVRTLHWVDIYPPPLDERLKGLIAILKQYIEITDLGIDSTKENIVPEGKGSSGPDKPSLNDRNKDSVATKILSKAEDQKDLPERLYHVGDRIKVLEGPFKDIVGMVEAINKDKNSVTIQLTIFGQSKPVELAFSQIELVY